MITYASLLTYACRNVNVYKHVICENSKIMNISKFETITNDF